jgi:DNA-binding NarL/FixJ family response regulator
MLAGADAPVVICERELPDGCWRDVMAQADALPRPPRIIVTSLFADESLWGEVLNLGGYDVLRKPFALDEVIRSVSLAAAPRPRHRAAGGVLDWPRSA